MYSYIRQLLAVDWLQLGFLEYLTSCGGGAPVAKGQFSWERGKCEPVRAITTAEGWGHQWSKEIWVGINSV